MLFHFFLMFFLMPYLRFCLLIISRVLMLFPLFLMMFSCPISVSTCLCSLFLISLIFFFSCSPSFSACVFSCYYVNSVLSNTSLYHVPLTDIPCMCFYIILLYSSFYCFSLSSSYSSKFPSHLFVFPCCFFYFLNCVTFL